MFRFFSPTMSAADLQELVEQTKRALETPVQTSDEDDFARRLKEATQRRRLSLGSRLGPIMASASDAESFGQKIKRAAEKHPNSRKRHQE